MIISFVGENKDSYINELGLSIMTNSNKMTIRLNERALFEKYNITHSELLKFLEFFREKFLIIFLSMELSKGTIIKAIKPDLIIDTEEITIKEAKKLIFIELGIK